MMMGYLQEYSKPYIDSTLIEIMAILLNNVMRSGEYPNCWSTDIIDG